MKKGILLIIAGVVGAATIYEFQNKPEGNKELLNIPKKQKTRRKIKAKKKKKKLLGIRSPYYEMHDKISGVIGNTPRRDNDLMNLAYRVRWAADKIGNHLNENYIWD